MTVTRAPASTGLRFGVLGPLHASRDGHDVPLGGLRQRSVVAVLLLARGRVVTADQIIDALWGEQPPRSAHSSLHAYISHLRRSLEPERAARSPSGVLVNQAGGYALRVDEDAVDAWRFERLVRTAADESDAAARAAALHEALDLWRGPLLSEYDGQPWVVAEASRLSELRNVAREELLAARLDLGETGLVVPEAEALLSEAPLREERWRLLALALYRSHRQADALATLRRARDLLADELGVDPGPALRALESEVLAQSERLAAPPRRTVSWAHSAPTAPTAPTAPPSPTAGAIAATGGASDRAADRGAPAPQIVDRGSELTQLREALTDALAGTARLVLLTGPAGIGKTTLLTEIRNQAREAGARVLSARGSQLERDFGLGVVRQLFEPLLTTPDDRGRLLTGAAEAAAAVFDATSADPSHGVYRADGMFGALHGLYWLSVNVTSQSPAVLAIDDLQWCDTGSLRFLAYLARRLEGLPLLLVATFRTGEEHDEELVTELMSDPTTTIVPPRPLSEAGVAELVRDRLGQQAEAAFITACHHITAGNPLLVRQLLRALEAEGIRPDGGHADTVRAIGSRAVSSLVLMRFARMPERCKTLARAVSVLGDGATLPVVARFTDLDEAEAAEAIAGLTRAEVLRPDYPLGFVHPLVGDAVYDDIPLAQRELAHDRAARVLMMSGASSEKVAAHLMLVPTRGDAQVVRTLTEAAARDAERGSSETAAGYLRRALAEPPAPAELPEVLLELGRLEAMTQGEAAIEHLTLAYRALQDPEDKAVAAIRLARTLIFGGERGRAAEVARAAIDDLPAHLHDERQALLALERLCGYMHALDPARYRAGAEPELVGEGVGARALAASLAWENLIGGTNRPRSIELARFAAESNRLREVDPGLTWVVAGMVLELSGVGELDYWHDSLAEAYQRGALFMALSSHLWLGFAEWRRGDLREALHSMASCAEQHTLWGGHALGRPYVDGYTVRLMVERGDVAGARRYLEEHVWPANFGEGVRLLGEAEAAVLLAEGRPESALLRLQSVQDEMAIVDNPVWRPWRTQRAIVLSALGRVGEAEELAVEELEVARRWGTDDLVGRTLRVLGELRGAAGLDVLLEAMEHLGRTDHLLERARVQAAVAAAMCARDQDLDHARELLLSSLELAEMCAADGLRARVSAALHELGVDVPALSPAAAPLTTAELRVATLAAAGLPQRAIAEGLFVTPAMVERTLRAVMSRLGVTNVEDLQAALDRL